MPHLAAALPARPAKPARVRRGFQNIHQMLPDLTSEPKPGPGRPPGSRNRRPATRHDAGKTVKRTAAKPQIGVGLRVFAYAVRSERGYLVNPLLEFPDAEEQDGVEGCLSFPGVYYDVKRRLNTVARGFTDRGDPVQVVGTEVLARCLQRETDHLDGVLFIDRMDAATRKLAMREIRASKWDVQMKMSRHRKTGRIL